MAASEELTVLKTNQVNDVIIVWFKDEQDRYGVYLTHTSSPNQIIKSWICDKLTTKEAFSHHWFEMLPKQLTSESSSPSIYGIPEEILDLNSDDLYKMLFRVIENI